MNIVAVRKRSKYLLVPIFFMKVFEILEGYHTSLMVTLWIITLELQLQLQL